jgi:hypothetical protein
MPVIPTSLIMAILFAAFIPATFSYFFRIPHARVVNVYSLVMGGAPVVMFFSVTLSALGVSVVWVSWVSLAIGIFLLVTAVRQVRAAWKMVQDRDRAEDDRIRRGQ